MRKLRTGHQIERQNGAKCRQSTQKSDKCRSAPSQNCGYLHAFRACIFLEWGGDTHVFCKALRTKPHWFSGKIVGLVGLVRLVRQLGQLGLACSINPLTSKTAFERKFFRRPLAACKLFMLVQALKYASCRSSHCCKQAKPAQF